MLCILPLDQSLHQTRSDSSSPSAPPGTNNQLSPIRSSRPASQGYRTQTMVTLLMGLTSIVFIWILGLVLI
ncbi:hypothetical protein E4A47_11485 [Micrococcus flavus]|nr:hypothetical protein E4A47_11485 [Micrococcus flavus]GGK55302.1 hypothetical protein GCM10007073_23040 [Micrococcus flavus]